MGNTTSGTSLIDQNIRIVKTVELDRYQKFMVSDTFEIEMIPSLSLINGKLESVKVSVSITEDAIQRCSKRLKYDTVEDILIFDRENRCFKKGLSGRLLNVSMCCSLGLLDRPYCDHIIYGEFEFNAKPIPKPKTKETHNQGGTIYCA